MKTYHHTRTLSTLKNQTTVEGEQITVCHSHTTTEWNAFQVCKTMQMNIHNISLNKRS